MKYRVVLSYLGSRYCGWQRQSGQKAHSIQETIETSIEKMTAERPSVVASGRTDAGVHASGQVAHFSFNNKKWDPRILFKGLNSILPWDIRILDLTEADDQFHAQRSATMKQYSYYFQLGPCAVPQFANTTVWTPWDLDLRLMNEAVQALKGEHDFKPFQASGAAVRTTIRTIYEIEVVPCPLQKMMGFDVSEDERYRLARLRIIGSGFLKQMVRSIAGTAFEVGKQKRSTESFREILESRRRQDVGATAPGRGLWLERVWY